MRLGVEELTPKTLKDPDIVRIARATELIDDCELTRISTHKRWAQVSPVTTDGRQFDDARRTPRGDADAPLSDSEISAKFHAFAGPVLGLERALRIEELAGQIDRLETTDFGELVDLCLTSPRSCSNVEEFD